MPLQATSGAASYDAFGGGVAVVPNYIEEVFATHLYTGNGSTQTITNGIDLAGKGGLVWTKWRTSDSSPDHGLFDTARGVGKLLSSNNNFAEQAQASSLTAFTGSGFSLGSDGGDTCNRPSTTYASWTFRKQPKFFDVVTWSGNGAASREIPHALGSTPGCVIAKRTNNTSSWSVYHRGVSGTLYLNLTNAAGTVTDITAVSATTFTVDSSRNASGSDYVAYLFAHNAGGFGLTGTDNVISCGSYTGNGSTSGPSITLGYEPQWVMIKNASSTGNWVMQDVMRGMPVGGNTMTLFADLSNAETDPGNSRVQPTATGFQIANTTSASLNTSGNTYIYIAIRRGPMRTPTTGTSVFQPLTRNGTGGATTVTSTVRPDTVLQNWRSGGLGSANHFMYDRLRGVAQALFTDTTGAESTQTATGINAFNNLSYGIAGAGSMNNGSALYADYVFTRAPGFFDEVCYTGTGSARTVAHNLGVAPEMMIVKSRSSGTLDWLVYSAPTGNANALLLNTTDASFGSTSWGSTTPTASVFSTGASGGTNNSGATFVAYLFASCPGVSKVGSYTGNGSSQTINMGFTGGARFFLVKRTDSTGDWWVYDSARGIVSAADPALRLNSTAAEVTSADAVDTDSTGLIVNQESTCNINVSSATYIYLGIA